MRRVFRQQVTPTLDTSAYATGDQMSTIQQVDISAMKFGTELITITVLDKASQSQALDIFFFEKSVTVAADNAAAAFSDADMEFCLGVVNVLAADYDSAGANNTIATVNLVPSMPLLSFTHGANIWFALVSRGSPTYAAGSLVLSFVGIQDGD